MMMKKIAPFVAVLALSVASALPVTASPATAPLTCPACKMPMPTAKAAGFTSLVTVNGKKYYCCTKCPIGIKAAAYAKTHKGKPYIVATGK